MKKLLSLPRLVGISLVRALRDINDFNKATNPKTGNINNKFNKRKRRGKK